ncbi:MAG: M3 family metallopeptidase [Opitutales bacterium]
MIIDNPFLDKTFPPKWKEMKGSFLKDDVTIAISRSKANIKEIKEQRELSYKNCVEAFELASADLDMAWSYAMHLDSVDDNQALRDAINETLPLVTDYNMSIYLDEDLYAIFKKFSKTKEAKHLSKNQKAALNEILEDFIDSGVAFSQKKKEKLKDLNQKLSFKTKKFSENVLDSTNAFSLEIKDEALLKGLPESAIALAKRNAQDKKLDGYLIKLQAPLVIAILSYSENGELREQIWKEFSNVAQNGEHSNTELIVDILELRMKIAKIFKDKNWADHILKRRMAKSGKKALSFVEDLHKKTQAYFIKEQGDIKEYAKKFFGQDYELKAFDIAFLSEKLRQEKYSFEQEKLRPYFVFEKCLDGLFKLSETLFGLKIKQAKTKNTWAKGLNFYEIHNCEGKHLGSFYTDFFPRSTKRAGAWMNILKGHEDNSPALLFIGGNLNAPTKDKPSLLNHDELCTLFHEFGHLLHFAMMDMPERSLRGVAWDFVELPSQILENWCYSKECLDTFAKHYKTNKAIPKALFDKMIKARKFQGALAFTRQLFFAKSDLELHINTKKYLKNGIREQLAKDTLDYKISYSHEIPSHLEKFTHIFGDEVGYSAGYYSYKWAELLDADAFSRFEEDGIFNAKTGMQFAKNILKVGRSISPEKAFKNFMQREPKAKALIDRNIEI